MSSNLRFIPPSTQPSTLSHAPALSGKNAPSAPTSVHDTLRNGLPNTAGALNIHHPLESRLRQWDAQQEKVKLEGLRRVFGLGEPLRRGMELKIVQGGDALRPAMLKFVGGYSGDVHEDILKGRDWDIQWEDVFTDVDQNNAPQSFHDEIEYKLRMRW